MPEDTMNLLDYLNLFWKGRWRVLGITAAATAGTLVISLLWPKTYQTTFTVQLPIVWRVPVEAYSIAADTLTREGTAHRVIAELGLDMTPRRFMQRVSAILLFSPTDRNTPVGLRIYVNGDSPANAVRIAEFIKGLMAKRYDPIHKETLQLKLDYERALEERLKSFEKTYAGVEQAIIEKSPDAGLTPPGMILAQMNQEGRYSQLTALMRELYDVRFNNRAPSSTAATTVLDHVFTPTQSFRPRIGTNTAWGTIIGFFAALLISFVIEYVKRAGGGTAAPERQG
jgi:uncharacterized protein involved in exopolysaccharide biosynthesis